MPKITTYEEPWKSIYVPCIENTNIKVWWKFKVSTIIRLWITTKLENSLLRDRYFTIIQFWQIFNTRPSKKCL